MLVHKKHKALFTKCCLKIRSKVNITNEPFFRQERSLTGKHTQCVHEFKYKINRAEFTVKNLSLNLME